MLRCDWLLNQTFIAQSEYPLIEIRNSDWTMFLHVIFNLKAFFKLF